MNVKIRLEEAKDYKLVEAITKEAFTRDDYLVDEHYIIHKLRQTDDFIKELTYVLVYEGKVVGQITYTKSRIVGDDIHHVISFGPVSIKPAFQGKGLGSLLIKTSLEKAKELGYKAVVIYGHKDYYPRFGFKNSAFYKIQTAEGTNHDYFMTLELQNGALDQVSGRFYYSKAFDVDKEALKAYDKAFTKDITSKSY